MPKKASKRESCPLKPRRATRVTRHRRARTTTRQQKCMRSATDMEMPMKRCETTSRDVPELSENTDDTTWWLHCPVPRGAERACQKVLRPDNSPLQACRCPSQQDTRWTRWTRRRPGGIPSGCRPASMHESQYRDSPLPLCPSSRLPEAKLEQPPRQPAY